MSDFNNLLEMIEIVPQEVIENIVETEKSSDVSKSAKVEIVRPFPTTFSPFDISLFAKELHERSAVKNQLYREAVQNINAYDLAQNCIRDIVYKLRNTPVESFADKWLPILMRASIGNAIHNFIQDNSDQFTEKEISVKIPSIRFSGRIDALIGSNILIEIKSCTYSDYEKIITSCRPRPADFYQAIAYKYMLENHLAEAKNSGVETRTQVPMLDKYDIQTIQFIYVAHDVTATDVESFGEMVNRIKELKRLLNSRSNTFFFITTLVIDLTNNLADPYIKYIKDKLEKINWYLDNDKLPAANDPYIDKTKCFFCLYKQLCDL